MGFTPVCKSSPMGFSWSGLELLCGWPCPPLRVILREHHSNQGCRGEGKAQVTEEILATVFVTKGKGFSPSHR